MEERKERGGMGEKGGEGRKGRMNVHTIDIRACTLTIEGRVYVVLHHSVDRIEHFTASTDCDSEIRYLDV